MEKLNLTLLSLKQNANRVKMLQCEMLNHLKTRDYEYKNVEFLQRF